MRANIKTRTREQEKHTKYTKHTHEYNDKQKRDGGKR